MSNVYIHMVNGLPDYQSVVKIIVEPNIKAGDFSTVR